MDKVKLVVMDLVGTTVRDNGEVVDAFTDALKRHRIKVTPDQLSKVRGSSKRQAVFDLIPASSGRYERADRVYASFCKNLTRRYRTFGVEPIEGAERVFAWLRQNKVRVALNTGFDRDVTQLLLAALRWDEGIADVVVCGDDVSQGRPAPELIYRAMAITGVDDSREVANVGDTALDVRAAHRAGVRWNIAVLSGAHDRTRLKREPYTHLLYSIAGLPGLLVQSISQV